MQWTSQVALVAENPPANVEDLRDVDWIPGSGRPLEEGMTIHSSYFCLVNRLDRGPCRLQSKVLQKVDMTEVT